MANELNIGVRFGAEGIPEVTKSISQLDAQLKRFQKGLNTATGVDSIARLNRAIAETKTRMENLAKFTGLAGDEINDSFNKTLKPIGELEQEIGRLEGAIKKSTNPAQIKKFADQVERLKTQINNIKVVGFQTSLGKIDESASNAARGLNRIRPASAGATESMINLSRIAQDAPFGFIGIANNINPLLESFQRLKAQTGTTKSAFAALIGSLSGAGGLGLAVGIGSAALTLLGQGFFSGGRAAKKAKEEVDDFTKTLESAASDVARDATRVTVLFNALTSGTINIDQRKKALEELKSINKDFFGSLREEEGLVKNLQTAYDQYLKNLQDIGRAKAIESQLTKLFDKKLQLELAIDPKFAGAIDPAIQSNIGRLRKELESLGGALKPEELQKEINFFDKANESLKRRVEIQQQLQKLEQGIKFLPDAGVRSILKQVELIDLQIAGLSKLQKDTGDFQLQTDKHSDKEEDSLKRRLTALEKIRDATKDISVVADLQEQIFDLQVKITLRDAAKNGLSREETDLAIKGFRDQLTDAFNKEVLSLEGSPKIKFTKVEFAPLDPGVVESEIAKATGLDKKIPIQSDREVKIKLLGIEFVESEEQAKAAVEKLKSVILNATTTALGDTVSLFGETLGAIFSGEGIGSAITKAAEGLLRILGGALQAIGQQIIATSALVETLKKALNNLFGPGGTQIGFAVGAALIGLGGLLKNLKLPAFAGGVNNFSGGLAIVGERGPELVNLPRGSDVIPNHMIGNGQVNVTLQPSLTYDRRGLVVAIQQVLESNSRMGGATL